MDWHAKCWALTRSKVDSLRIEASVATPAQQRLLRGTALQVKESVIGEYGAYLPRKTLGRAAHVEDRIIMVSAEDFEKFPSAWAELDAAPGSVTKGTKFYDGEFVVLKDPRFAWHIADNNTRKMLTGHFGEETRARRAHAALIGTSS
jgi:hypothetical protein